jgi:hypothetical protein
VGGEMKKELLYQCVWVLGVLVFLKCAAKSKHIRVEEEYFHNQTEHLVLLPLSLMCEYNPITIDPDTNQLINSSIEKCWNNEVHQFFIQNTKEVKGIKSLDLESEDIEVFKKIANSDGMGKAIQDIAEKHNTSVIILTFEKLIATATSSEFSSELTANWHGVKRHAGESEIAPKAAKFCFFTFLQAACLGPYATTPVDASEKQNLAVISLSMKVYDKGGTLLWESYGGYDVLQKKVGGYFLTIPLGEIFTCDQKQKEKEECVKVCLLPFMKERFGYKQ